VSRTGSVVTVVSLVMAVGADVARSDSPLPLLAYERSSTPLDGRWQTGRMSQKVFVASALKVGATRAQAIDFFHHLGEGTRRYARITLIFRNGNFREYQAGDGGRAVIGNEEPYNVGRDVLRLLGSGAEAGCVASFRFVIRANRLRLRFISVRGSTCPPVTAGPHWGVALYTAAPFTRRP
jgi:hypothetical protein